MRTKLFHRLPYLLCLFQIPCFAALQTSSSDSSSFSDCSDAHKKIDVVCNNHLGGLGIEPSSFRNELLVYGFIRELEPKVANKIIPDDIINLCVGFSRRMLPCDCIKEKLRKILPNKNLKKALVFFLMYKIQDVQDEKDKLRRTLLHCACKDGQLGLAKLLKERGANIKAKNKYESNALHHACCNSGSVPMVTWLLDECHIGLETKGYTQRTPFLCAAQKGQLAIAKLLKERSANINEKNEYGNNALHLACGYSGSEAMVTWLLDDCNIGLETKGYEQRTPFLCAAQKGQLAIAKLLKERGANIHAKSKHKNNALHYACLFSGSVDMVTWLLDDGNIGLETKGYTQRTPFLCAAQKGQLAIAKLLKERGANIHAKSKHKNNALHLACGYSGSEAMVTWLLDDCNIGLETKGYEQRTPFLCAAQKGQLAIAKLLKERSANVNEKNKYRNNALHIACLFSGSEAMVTWLLDDGKIGLETKGRYQTTPFLCAAEKGQLAIAKLLKKRGANIKVKNECRNNALHMACLVSGSVEMVTWLLDICNIGLETKGYKQQTPFLCAAEKGQLAIAKLLKERSANVNEKNEYRNNALHLASLFSGSEAMVTWLLDVCKIGLETKGECQKTPFLCAAQKGQLTIAKLLRQRGANIHAKNFWKKNALNLAPSTDEEMINWLFNVCELKKATCVSFFTASFRLRAMK